MTETSITIPNLENLIKKCVSGNKKVLSCQVINMTKPGENYAGVMLRVEITLINNGKNEKLHGVAKTPNFNVNEFFRSHIPIQYKKEVSFYRDVVPTIKKFHLEEGAGPLPDIFPEMYASRFNLTEDPEKVDEHALILLENLVEKGINLINFDLVK